MFVSSLKKWFCWQYAEFTHTQTQSAALTVVLKELLLQESVPATMEGNASQTCGWLKTKSDKNEVMAT